MDVPREEMKNTWDRRASNWLFKHTRCGAKFRERQKGSGKRLLVFGPLAALGDAVSRARGYLKGEVELSDASDWEEERKREAEERKKKWPQGPDLQEAPKVRRRERYEYAAKGQRRGREHQRDAAKGGGRQDAAKGEGRQDAAMGSQQDAAQDWQRSAQQQQQQQWQWQQWQEGLQRQALQQQWQEEKDRWFAHQRQKERQRQ